MKIQDLRDDLAEMRYFRKSYLRKMKNEMGGIGGMLPMDGTLGGGGGGGGGGMVRPAEPVYKGRPTSPDDPRFDGWDIEDIIRHLKFLHDPDPIVIEPHDTIWPHPQPPLKAPPHRPSAAPRDLEGPPPPPPTGNWPQPEPEPHGPLDDNNPIGIGDVEGVDDLVALLRRLTGTMT